MKYLTFVVIFYAALLFGKGELPRLEKAPDFVGISQWINSPPLRLSELSGKVVLVDFWTYSCINCIRTFPYLIKWYDTYKDKGFVIIGVHSPEFSFEKSTQNVESAAKRFGINYPIALDNDMDTWKAYHNQFWPAKYLIDQYGIIRKKHFGEGGYLEMENAIRSLLEIPLIEPREPERKRFDLLSQEAYLGFGRADRYARGMEVIPNQPFEYHVKLPLEPDEIGLQGIWRIGSENITAIGSDSKILINFLAASVYIVLSGKSNEPVTLLLDGAPLPEKYFTRDMDAQGRIFIDGDRKYDLLNKHGDIKRHTLTVELPPGISAYAFTFGAEQ